VRGPSIASLPLLRRRPCCGVGCRHGSASLALLHAEWAPWDEVIRCRTRRWATVCAIDFAGANALCSPISIQRHSTWTPVTGPRLSPRTRQSFRFTCICHPADMRPVCEVGPPAGCDWWTSGPAHGAEYAASASGTLAYATPGASIPPKSWRLWRTRATLTTMTRVGAACGCPHYGEEQRYHHTIVASTPADEIQGLHLARQVGIWMAGMRGAAPSRPDCSVDRVTRVSCPRSAVGPPGFHAMSSGPPRRDGAARTPSSRARSVSLPIPRRFYRQAPTLTLRSLPRLPGGRACANESFRSRSYPAKKRGRGRGCGGSWMPFP